MPALQRLLWQCDPLGRFVRQQASDETLTFGYALDLERHGVDRLLDMSQALRHFLIAARNPRFFFPSSSERADERHADS